MLAANVLCIKKKKKKKAYSLSSTKNQRKHGADESISRTSGGAVTMLQVTEDTPPDMLSGAMDLTVHLPAGKPVKMAVERSTPMMDLLVQITAKHQLQLSNYTLQALGMAPSAQHSDTVLPYKPNTPIGTLDTQHVKVIPKSRSIPVVKNVAPGHQPFESTFRLKVHLPRNQLYVTRVSRNVVLEDIMREVCHEKNLNPSKYEFKHPANPDEVLDPKLTLSDYQITEIYLVLKGTLTQAFSTTDIMGLRKEEDRKQMHSKTGGGVFNLIFRRGKSSVGSGSISSENRSISPTHSEESRSATPPNPPPAVAPSPKIDPPVEKPKPPQRKRRPAPKPPVNNESSRRDSEEKPPSDVSSEVSKQMEQPPMRKTDNGLTICHSRNSSDSSGYHEASVLSENCNTSLPRRPKSAFVTAGDREKLSKLHSQSTTNLTKMTPHSKSTTSLAIAGRRKKAAPPPPPLVRASNPAINIETPSPVVASQSILTPKDLPATQETILAQSNPSPIPRRRSEAPPQPVPRKLKYDTGQTRHEHLRNNEVHQKIEAVENISTIKFDETQDMIYSETYNSPLGPAVMETNDESSMESEHKSDGLEKYWDIKKENAVVTREDEMLQNKYSTETVEESNHDIRATSELGRVDNEAVIDELFNGLNIHLDVDEALHEDKKGGQDMCKDKEVDINNSGTSNEELHTLSITESGKSNVSLSTLQAFAAQDIFKSSEFQGKRPPAIVALIPKASKTKESFVTPDSQQVEVIPQVERRLEDPLNFVDRGLLESRADSSSSCLSSPIKSLNSPEHFFDTEDEEGEQHDSYNQFQDKSNRRKKISVTSLRSMNSLYDFGGGSGLKKWNNLEDLDHDSLTSFGPYNRWVVGDSFGPESLASQQTLDSLASLEVGTQENICFGSTDSGIAQETTEKIIEPDDVPSISPPPPPILEDETKPTLECAVVPEPVVDVQPLLDNIAKETNKEDLATSHTVSSISSPSEVILPNLNNQDSQIADLDWHYQLPSPPKAFRDSSPVAFEGFESHSLTDFKDSVVTSPELFEKLKNIEDNQIEQETASSDLTSIVSEEEKPPLLNTLSLEHLEKRKSLVYNRVLATSLKMTDNDIEDKINEAESFSSSLTKFESAFNEIQNSSQIKTTETKSRTTNIGTHTLPNFKISAYDKPKQKIKVFEDDTIRSNTDYINKESSLSSQGFVNKSAYSTDITSKRKNSIDSPTRYSNEDKDYYFHKSEGKPPKSIGTALNMSRSESFTRDSVWSPVKPVSRSKSHLNLDNNRFRETQKEETISRSNSLYDGLQSLGVLRLIQNKLNTPSSSMENVGDQTSKNIQPVAAISPKPEVSDKDKFSSAQGKQFRYYSPPSVNMSTWSERPKIPVAVKADADYKLGNNNLSSKLIVNTTNNSIISSNTVEVRTENSRSADANALEYNQNCGINIKVNGSDSVNNNQPRNVVIKIGSQQPKVLDNQRFINHTTAVGYRRPFNNINSNQRPHSIAFDSEFDISRVPVVRSVELKKPFKDNNNTSVTQINHSKHVSKEPVSELMSKFSSMNRSSEIAPNKINPSQNCEVKESKPVVRANSLRPQIAPVVRGFNSMNMHDHRSNRFSWNTTNTYNTLPTEVKEKDDFLTNKHVPFSQSHLRRTESNKIIDKNIYNKGNEEKCGTLVIDTNSYQSLPISEQEFKKPPPPPAMGNLKPVKRRIIEPVADPRDQLMSAIRNFGGKKGLKTVKS